MIALHDLPPLPPGEVAFGIDAQTTCEFRPLASLDAMQDLPVGMARADEMERPVAAPRPSRHPLRLHVRFRIESDPDETLRGCQAAARAATAPLGPSSAGWIIVLAYVAIGALAYWLAVRDWLLVAALASIGVLLAWAGVTWEARHRARRLLALDPHSREPYELELSEAGLRTWCGHVDLRITWDAITHVTETSEFYLFIRGASGGPALPKRILDDDQDRALRTALRQWAPPGSLDLAREPAGTGTAPVAAT